MRSERRLVGEDNEHRDHLVPRQGPEMTLVRRVDRAGPHGGSEKQEEEKLGCPFGKPA
jgi:hypothetical protein